MANIKLNNNSYPIPDSKLASIKADFVAHLGTIAGSGMKVVIGGVEYGIDATKMEDAFEAFEGVLGELENGGEPELGFPITWNSMEVMGNTTLPIGEWGSVKVSDYVPSVDEMANTILTVTDTDETRIFKYHETYTTDIFYSVIYKLESGLKNESMSISIFPTSLEADGITVEAGLYAANYGSIGVNADCVLDIVSEEYLEDNGQVTL